MGGVSGLVVAVSVSLTAFAFLLWLAITASRAQLLSWWAVPSAALLGGVAYGTFLVRKDTLILAILAICLWILARRGSLWIKLVMVNVLSIAGVLSHEAYAVLALPALTIIGSSLVRRVAREMRGRVIVQVAWILPSWLAVAATVVNSRPARGVGPIWQSWFQSGASLGMDGESPSMITGAVDALQWDMSKALSLSSTVFTSPRAIIWLAIATVSFSLIHAAFVQVTRRGTPVSLWPFTFRALLLMQVLLSGLLWLSGWDYSRWIVMTCISVALIWGWNLWSIRLSESPVLVQPSIVRRVPKWVFPTVALVFSTAGAGPWVAGTYIRGMPIVQIPILVAEVLNISRASLPIWIP